MLTTAPTVPPRIKGIRRPSRLRHRSDSAPKKGSMNRASTLSMAMMTPETVSPTPKLFLRISGTTPS